MRPLLEFVFYFALENPYNSLLTVLPDFKSGQIFQVNMVCILLFAVILIHKVIKEKKERERLYCANLPSQDGAHLSILLCPS